MRLGANVVRGRRLETSEPGSPGRSRRGYFTGVINDAFATMGAVMAMIVGIAMFGVGFLSGKKKAE